MIDRVFAALRASGGLNAGTPLAIASTPVRATEPPANALSRTNRPRVSVAVGRNTSVSTIGVTRPGHDVEQPEADHQQGQPDEQVGRDREDVARLAEAAQVADRDQRDRDEGDLDPVVVDRREHRLDLLDGGGRRHRDGHDVVDQQRRRGHQPGQLRQVLASDDVGAAAARVGPADLPVARPRRRPAGRRSRSTRRPSRRSPTAPRPRSGP